MAVDVRSARPDDGGEDEAFILALNAASTPAVSDLDLDDWRTLRDLAHAVLVAEVDGAPAGFIVLLRPGASYGSDNYAWFEQRFLRHYYIDRVAVAGHAKGMGVGRALYDAAARLGAGLGEQRLTCEVNIAPPNPDSLAFHERLGFRRLHERMSRSGKAVAMFERPL
ncbi:MAG: GNAT family N-acetyltransferase [Hyphomonadaceae bacterium]